MGARRVFISYRRQDSTAVVGRIRDHLVDHLGRDSVFKDVDSIAPGEDFREALRGSIATCDAMLVVIGPNWLLRRDGADQPRLFEPEDYVRTEIEQALAAQLTVIPVLVDGAAMPAAELLPSSIRSLTFRHAVSVRADPDFRTDIERLLEAEPFGLTVEDGSSRRRPGRRAQALTAIGVSVVAVAALVTALSTRGSSGGSDQASVLAGATARSGVSFVPAAEAATTGRVASLDETYAALPSEQITVKAESVRRPQGRSTYEVEHLIDRDLETAWTEGVPGDGKGQHLEFHFAVPTPLDRIEIWPGWQSSKQCRFEKNPRPTAIEALAFPVTGDQESATSAPADAADPKGRLLIPLRPLMYTDVTLTIAEVAPGTACDGGPVDDTTISEVRFFAAAECLNGYRVVDGELVQDTGADRPPQSC